MFSILQQKALKNPNDVYIIFKGQEYTFSDVYEKSKIIATSLSNNGINTGDRVGVALPTGIDYIYLIYALMKLRAILIPLNTRLTINELIWQISLVDSTNIIYNSEYKKMANQIADSIESVHILDIETINTETDETTGESSIQIEDNSLTHCIIFTSGTTKSPKGVILSYSNHLSHIDAHADRIPFKENDRRLSCIPLYHVGGLQIILRCLNFGMPVVLHNRFVIDEIIDSIYQDKITIISLVPTMLKRILEKSELQNTNLRCILLGGAKTTLDLVNLSLSLSLPICTTYGMTESNSQVCTILTEGLRKKPESVGKPISGLNIIIVDEFDNKLGVDKIGEICVRGSSITNGYYNQPKINSQSFLNDYFKTGDLGYIDEDGDLFVIQRRIDLIVSGGENVYPSEVEKVLLQNESIRNAVVFGEADAEWGQIVVATIILNSAITEQAIIDYCRQYLASYKIPRKYYVLTEFEETSTGKIIRKKVIDATLNAKKILP